MKKIFPFIAAACLIAIGGTSSYAQDLYDHELYKVVTYSFNDNTDSNGAVIPKKVDHFEPLMITRTKANLMSSQMPADDQNGFTTGRDLVQGMVQGFAISADYNATPRLAFRGVIGVTKNTNDTSLRLGFDSSWEANVGVVYKLFNNFSYEVHLGFMDTGDVFKSSSAFHDVENIVMINNQLTMSF
jgi:hypothetical protein